MSDQVQPRVATLALLGYLVAVITWQLEIGVQLLHFFAQKKLDPIAHGALLGMLVALTTFTFIRGKHDFELLRATRGRVPLTAPQVAIITMFVVALGTILGLITMRLVNG